MVSASKPHKLCSALLQHTDTLSRVKVITGTVAVSTRKPFLTVPADIFRYRQQDPPDSEVERYATTYVKRKGKWDWNGTCSQACLIPSSIPLLHKHDPSHAMTASPGLVVDPMPVMPLLGQR